MAKIIITKREKNNKIIIKQQAGFRKNLQTKDNIFVLIQKTTEHQKTV